MQTGLLHLHNILRWVLLILLLVSLIRAFAGWQMKKNFSPGDGKLWLFTMISAHITLLVGLYLVLMGRYGILNTQLPAGTNLMKDKFYRFFWIEHPVAMILSIVFITLGRGMVKKAVPAQTKYRKAFWFFLIALLLILAAVPWPFRDVVGRPWAPGM
ncbi:MAG: hypothetical protein JO301_02225 [Chitinophagaceae bacterium]|nr:hypothetical protein [Chitinophagaceae bacterium]